MEQAGSSKQPEKTENPGPSEQPGQFKYTIEALRKRQSDAADLYSQYHRLPGTIQVTHIVDPNRLFAYYKDTPARLAIEPMEMEMQQFYDSGPSLLLSLKPKVNENIGFFHYNWNKHIRATFDFVETDKDEKKYLCWALDYGIPLETKWGSRLKKLPSKFMQYRSSIFEVHLPIRPIYKDYENGSLITKKCSDWSPDSIELFKNIISSDEYDEFKFEVYEEYDDFVYGDILMKSFFWDKVYSLKNMMVEYEVAAEIPMRSINPNKGCQISKQRRHGGVCYNIMGECMCPQAFKLT